LNKFKISWQVFWLIPAVDAFPSGPGNYRDRKQWQKVIQQLKLLIAVGTYSCGYSSGF